MLEAFPFNMEAFVPPDVDHICTYHGRHPARHLSCRSYININTIVIEGRGAALYYTLWILETVRAAATSSTHTSPYLIGYITRHAPGVGASAGTWDEIVSVALK